LNVLTAIDGTPLRKMIMTNINSFVMTQNTAWVEFLDAAFLKELLTL